MRARQIGKFFRANFRAITRHHREQIRAGERGNRAARAFVRAHRDGTAGRENDNAFHKYHPSFRARREISARPIRDFSRVLEMTNRKFD